MMWQQPPLPRRPCQQRILQAKTSVMPDKQGRASLLSTFPPVGSQLRSRSDFYFLKCTFDHVTSLLQSLCRVRTARGVRSEPLLTVTKISPVSCLPFPSSLSLPHSCFISAPRIAHLRHFASTVSKAESLFHNASYAWVISNINLQFRSPWQQPPSLRCDARSLLSLIASSVFCIPL